MKTATMTPKKQTGFKRVGQKIRFECLGKICGAVIMSYSNNFDGSITFSTNQGEIEDTQVTEYL